MNENIFILKKFRFHMENPSIQITQSLEIFKIYQFFTIFIKVNYPLLP